jgi:hypothetical protein
LARGGGRTGDPAHPVGAARRDLSRLARSVERRLASRWFVDLGGGAEDTVLLAGSGRSGTTWLAEVLTRGGGYRYLFEPFHPVRSPFARLFPARAYLGPADGDPRQASGAERVVDGHVRTAWIDQYNRQMIARRRLVKDVWSNLRLGWLRAAFPSLRTILVVRHPCPTVVSQLASGWNWYADPPTFLGQPALLRRHLEPFADTIASSADDLERHVNAWCVDTLVPMRELASGGVHVVFYEHLLARPEEELSSLFAFLGRSARPDVLRLALDPSATSGPHSAVVTGGDALASWIGKVPAEDVRRTIAILERFGLDRLYGPEPMPRMRSGSDALAAGWT